MRRAAAALAFLLAAFTFPTAFAGAVDAPATTHQVTVLTRTFVDRSRQTPAVPAAHVTAAPTRTLVTTIWVPNGHGPFPLVVFAHGYGANPQVYGPVVRPWAEAGFVVAAPAFPVSSHGGPNYAGILDAANQPGDVSFVITRVLALSLRPGALHGKVDPGRIGVGGHSLGAITTLGVVERSCCRDHRVDAAISISGTPLLRGTDFAGKAPPLLLIHGDHDQTVNYAGSTTARRRRGW